MKKILMILLTSLIFISACTKEETLPKKENTQKKDKEVINKYQDLNNTPIGIYKLDNNKLVKVTDFEKKLNIEEDIDIFQIYPSKEKIINLNNSFGEDFYNEWNKYNNIKLGFNIKYTINNKEVSYNILKIADTFKNWEYIMEYIYDDYINKDKSFYSHIESKDETSKTLFTSIKLQAAYKCTEIDNIKLSVFTYDSDDDFDNNEYRGNSIDTIIINNKK